MSSQHSHENLELNTLLEKAQRLSAQDAHAALLLADEAVRYARTLAEPGSLARALRLRAMSLGATGNIGDAQRDFQEALLLAERSHDLILVGQCLHGKAVALKHLGFYPEAITTIERAVEIFRDLKQLHALQLSLNSLAAFHGSLSSYGEAIACLTEALGLAQGNPSAMAEILSNIAMVYLESGQLDEALRSFEESLATDAALTHASYRCNTLIHYAHALQQAGKDEAAVVTAESALQLAYNQHNQPLEAAALVALGCALTVPSQAETTLQAAFSLAERLSLPEPLLSATQALGTFYVKQSRATEGIPWLLRALALAETHQRIFLQSQLHQTLSQGYEALGELARALAHHQRFHQLFAQLHQESAKHRLQSQLARQENQRMQQEADELRRQVLEDPLTQLYNRRFLSQFLEREIARSRRYHLPLSVILVDIDDFKRVNDQHSHRTGDQVLLAFATLLRQCSRQSDLLVRQSGDEFVILIPETTLPDAQRFAERLRQRIESHDWDSIAPGLKLTASIGVADLLSDEDLLDRADKHLYSAKRTGKNQVVA